MAGGALDVLRHDPSVRPRSRHGRDVDTERGRQPPGVGRRQDPAVDAVSRGRYALSLVLAVVSRGVAALVVVEEEGDALTTPVGTADLGDSMDPSRSRCLNFGLHLVGLD